VKVFIIVTLNILFYFAQKYQIKRPFLGTLILRIF